jgi:hypothetical protein
MYGWKLVWAKDAQGEIGKIPPQPPGTVEIDWTRAALIEFAMPGRKGRGRA